MQNEVPEGTSQDSKKRSRESVAQAMMDRLARKEIKSDDVGVHDVCGHLGDGLRLVTVDMRPGRDAGRNKAPRDAIAALLQRALNSDPVDLHVLFRETPATNHDTGGTPLPGWVPADQSQMVRPLLSSAARGG